MEDMKLCIVFRVNKQTKANFNACLRQIAAERIAFSLIRGFILVGRLKKGKGKNNSELIPKLSD